MVDGMQISKVNNNHCDVCVMGKQTRRPFKTSETRSTKVLELIHSDVCGPMQEASFADALYFVTFIDDYSGKTFAYTMKRKSEVIDKFKSFKSFVERSTGKTIKMFRSDGGGEYTSNVFRKLFDDCGIVHQMSAPHTPE